MLSQFAIQNAVTEFRKTSMILAMYLFFSEIFNGIT